MRRFLNLHAIVQVAEDSADFFLKFQAMENGTPRAEIGTVNIVDTNAIHAIIQAYRMGGRYGKEEN